MTDTSAQNGQGAKEGAPDYQAPSLAQGVQGTDLDRATAAYRKARRENES
jgi:hypothetical protein